MGSLSSSYWIVPQKCFLDTRIFKNDIKIFLHKLTIEIHPKQDKECNQCLPPFQTRVPSSKNIRWYQKTLFSYKVAYRVWRIYSFLRISNGKNSQLLSHETSSSTPLCPSESSCHHTIHSFNWIKISSRTEVIYFIIHLCVPHIELTQ